MSDESLRAKRLAWEDLPARARSVVESLVGCVSASASSQAGLNSHLASTLHVPEGKVFIKGLPSNHRSASKQNNEASIGSIVHGISPRVLHHVDTGEWNFLIFEHFNGRHASLTPRSPDLALILSVLQKVLAVREYDTSVSLPVEERWARFGDGLNLRLLAGDSLIHADPNRRNILIGEERSVLVDWSLPGRGASWLNIAFMVSTLVSEGFHPEQAEQWARQFKEWRDADSHAIDTFATALLRRREEQATTCPEPRRTERQRLAYFARTWLNHRWQTSN